MTWNGPPRGVTYRDIFFDSEVEYCKYNFEHADVDKLLHVFGEWEAEGKRLLEQNLILPAYDHCLRLSHLFNVLDARGAFSVAERGRFLLRCRAIAEQCAKGFLAQRTEANYPMLRLAQPVDYTEPAPAAADLSAYAERETLLLEIGVEELPHGDIQDLTAALPGLVNTLFAQSGIICDGEPTILIAPRRIAIIAKNVPARQADVEKEARGPKRGSAQNSDGTWTVAADRFAAANGITVNEIFFREQGNAEYCFAKTVQKGKHLAEVFSDLVSQLLKGIRFGKSMGWGGHHGYVLAAGALDCGAARRRGDSGRVAIARDVRDWRGTLPVLGPRVLWTQASGARRGCVQERLGLSGRAPQALRPGRLGGAHEAGSGTASRRFPRRTRSRRRMTPICSTKSPTSPSGRNRSCVRFRKNSWISRKM